MNFLVERIAALVTRFPAAVVVALVVVTGVLGLFAVEQEFDPDMSSFAPEGELEELARRMDDEFGSSERQAQIIVDAGRGGNVLSPEGLAAADALETAIVEDPAISGLLADDGLMGGGGVIGYATPLSAQLQQLDMEPAEVGQGFVDAARDEALSGQQGERIRMLLSRDFDGESARGGLVIVNLDSDVNPARLDAAHRAIGEAVDRADTGFFDANAFSFAIVQDDMEGAMQRDMPRLLGASFLLILLILAVQFRRVSDVLVGAVGLAAALIWMSGISVLLGPAYLGVAGPFNQVAMAVPVLLVGLGIDYSVHLTTRYREERATGALAATAARGAVVTVGVALSLATLTTAVGFLSNWFSPLPPIADFGLFAAGGILSAAVVLGLLVPSARVLLDRGSAPAPLPAGSGPQAERETALSRLPARAPLATVTAGILLAVAGGLLATDLDATFSREEFVPEGSYAATVLDRVETLFGGDISERTRVLVDGDVRDRDAFAQLVAAEESLAEVEGVRTIAGRADVTSPASVVREVARLTVAGRQQLAAQFALLHDPEAGMNALPLPDELTYADLPPDLRAEMDETDRLPAGEVDLPVDDFEALERRLPAGVSAAEALLSSLPDAELVTALRGGLAQQIEEDAPDVAPEVVAELAALEPAELSLERIRVAGYPLEELPDQALDLLRASDELRMHGWADGELAPDADVAAILTVAREHAGDMLDGVLAEDAALISISTQAGEQGAERLTAEVEERLEPLAATVGGGIGVVSEPLLMELTLQQLTASQVRAIVVSLLAAVMLMTLYYGMTARRPFLGPITMLPSLLSMPLILGSMWLVGLPFNALTATVSSISIGIGVPYGIHVTNRFLEERARNGDESAAIRRTLDRLSGALVGSAVTTAAGFGVLMLSDLAPLRQFGGVTAVTILYALMVALLIESSALVLWGRWHRQRTQRCRGAPEEREAVPAEPESPAPTLIHRHRGARGAGQVPG